MNTVFTQEVGIRPWDQLHPTKECEFSTISLINQDFNSVWRTWCELASLLTMEWPTIITWYTLRFPHDSKTQEYLTLKEHAKSSAPNDILRKNETTSIYSGIENLNSKPDQIDPSRLTNYRYCVTLMQKQNSNLENLWHRLSNLNYLSKTDDFKLILSEKSSLAFRFFDEETHGVSQLICHSEHSDRIIEKVNTLNIERISIEDIYDYIHR